MSLTHVPRSSSFDLDRLQPYVPTALRIALGIAGLLLSVFGLTAFYDYFLGR